MKLPKINLFEILSVCLLAVFLSIVFTFPAVLSINSKFIGDGGDNYEYAGYMGLAAKHIALGSYPFTPTDYWRYPAGFDFSRGFDSYLSVGLGTLLASIMNLTVAYNLTVLLLMSINGVISYLFFKQFLRSRLLGVTGMLLYGYSFYALAKASSHLNLLCVSGVPLLGLSILRIIRNQELSRTDFALLFASFIFISIGSTQYLIMALLMLAIYLLVFLLFEKEQTLNLLKKIFTYKKELILPSIVAVCVLLALYFPHLKAVVDGKFILLKREDTLYTLTPSLTDYILPNSYLRLFISKYVTSASLPSIEKIVFVGWIELLFFIGFLFSPVRMRIKKIVLLLFAIPFLLSLGFGKDNQLFFLPYRFISETFPFNALVETSRYIIIFYLFLVCAVLLLINSIKSKSVRIIFIAVLLLAAFLERLPSNYYLVDDLSKKPYVKMVKKQESQAVLDLPVNLYYAPYNVLSLYYDKAIVNGYFHWSADGDKEKGFINDRELLSRFVCSDTDRLLSSFDEEKLNKDLLKTLADNNITTIVVHKDDKFFHPVCTNVRARINQLLPENVTITPTGNNIKEIIMTVTNRKPTFSFFFPQNGKLSLESTYIAPSNPAKFAIKYNNSSAPFGYNFKQDPNNSMQLLPQNSILHPVQAGDTLVFYSDTTINHTYLSFRYRFIEEAGPSVKFKMPVEKIFDDKDGSVYTINSDRL